MSIKTECTEVKVNNWKYDDFSLFKQLQEGTFSEVYSAYHKPTDTTYALKKIYKTTLEKYPYFSLQNELDIHYSLSSHPHIVKLYGHFTHENDNYMVLEYSALGDIFTSGQNLSEDIVVSVVKQLLLALKYCHDNNIIHRDVKPENVLMFKDGQVKLTDFGLSEKVKDIHVSNRNDICGTVEYLAPEIFLGNKYGYEIDLWTLGLLTYELLIGNSLYTVRSLMYSLNDEIRWPSDNTLSTNVKNFISSLIKLDPKQRMTTKEALNHPFISQNDLSLNMS
jgi:aurora kinase